MRNLPNILTIFRIALVPVFIYFMFYFEPKSIAAFASLFVFVTASITDYYDGMLARKYKMISNFGKIMDPLADKFLVISALFSLSTETYYFIPFAVVIIIIIREVAVTILRNYYVKKNIYIAANKWGKLKTVFQLTGIIAALVYVSLTFIFKDLVQYNLIVFKSFRYFFWIVALITVLSGINYFTKLGDKK
jgi:CDP-diacylglycerol--glycerol-3-phosphate 3-phosphatidyltransferase